MNIRVDLNTAIYDGTEVVFRSPVDCSQITGLIVYYKNKGSTAFQEFALADAHGNNVGDIDHLFAENVVVKVILDVTTGMAFVQNADTNAYLESRFDELNARIDGAYVLVKGDDDALSLEGVTCTELLEKFKASEELVLYRYKKDNSGNTIAIRYYYCMGIETRDGKETLVFQYSLGAENEYITLYVNGTPTGAVDVITITTDYKRLDVTIDDATMKASHTAYEIMDLWRKGWTVYCNGDMLYEAYGHSGSEASEIGVVFKGGFYAGADGYAYLKGETTINGNGDVSYKTYNLPILDDAQAGEYNTWSAKKIAEELAKGGGNGIVMLVATITHNEDGEISCDVDPSQIRAALNSPNKTIKIVVNQQIKGKRLFEPSVSVDLDGNISLYFADCRYEYDEITQSGWYYHSTVLPNGDEVSY